MTSKWARNYVSEGLDRDYYLHTNKEGQPLQGQVPQTYQRYTGVGPESIAIEGTNRIVLESNLSGGPLVINALDNYNLHGRVVHIVVPQTLQNALTLNYANGLIHTDGTDTTSDILVFSAGRAPCVITMDFYGLTDVFVSVSDPDGPNPPATQTRILYSYLLEGTQTLDNEVAQRLEWEDPPTYNSSSIVYDAVYREFEITRAKEYIIKAVIRGMGFLDRTLLVTLNEGSAPDTSFAVMDIGHTQTGNVDFYVALEWAGYLPVGQRISVNSMLSSYSPPIDPGYGLMTADNIRIDVPLFSFIEFIEL